MAEAAPRTLLFSAQKNEGPFLLEWVAWHKVIGFDRIAVVSNDCEDGSDDLLDRLADLGEVIHIRQKVPPDTAPQANAERVARERGVFVDGEWILWLDSDEFLLPSPPSRSVGDLIAAMGDAQALMIAWRFFGDSGHKTWPGRHVDDSFVMAQARRKGANAQVKTLFRIGPAVERLDIHRPILRVGTTRSEFPVITSSGGPADDLFYDTTRDRAFNRLVGQKRPYYLAQICHFSIRTADMFMRKARRGDGYYADPDTVRRDKDLYRRRNFNDVPDRGLVERKGEVDAEMQRLIALPGVAGACSNIDGFSLSADSAPADKPM